MTDSLVGSRLRGYIIESKLDEGGMGIVYRATHGVLHTPAAIKVLRPQYSSEPKHIRLLFDEARTVATLAERGAAGQHLCRILDAGIEDGHVFIAMELLTGASLAKHIAAGPLSVARAVDILGQVLRVLSLVHAENIVHRDLKPSNIFVCTAPGGGDLVKVLDFGIAKIQGRDFTVQGAGTPLYMAPEQFSAASTAAVDVYALGLILFEMIAGYLPSYEEKRRPNPLMSSLPERRRADVPPWIADLVAACLRQEPAERPADATALLAKLEGARVEAPSSPAVVVAPTAALPVARRRTPLVVGGIAASAALVAILAIVRPWRSSSSTPAGGEATEVADPTPPPPDSANPPPQIDRPGSAVATTVGSGSGSGSAPPKEPAATSASTPPAPPPEPPSFDARGCVRLASGFYDAAIDSAPQGATVYLVRKDCGALGKTPWNGKLPALGGVDMIVELEGYEPSKKSLAIKRVHARQQYFVPLARIDTLPSRADICAATPAVDAWLSTHDIHRAYAFDAKSKNAYPIIIAAAAFCTYGTPGISHLIDRGASWTTLDDEGYPVIFVWIANHDPPAETFDAFLREVRAKGGDINIRAKNETLLTAVKRHYPAGSRQDELVAVLKKHGAVE